MKKFTYATLILIIVFSVFAFIVTSKKNEGNTIVNLEKVIENSNGVIITINSNKFDYLESEPIWVEINIIIDENTRLDRAPILHLPDDLECILINSAGDTLKYRGGFFESVGNHKYPDTIFHVENLLNYYGINERFTHSNLLMSYYLPEDSYTVTFIFHAEINGISKSFISNKINFRVKKPENEELAAYHEWLKLMEVTEDLSEKDNSIRFKKMKDVVDDIIHLYPNSVYIFKAKLELIVCSGFDNNFLNARKEYLVKEINTYPDNYDNFLYLLVLEQVYFENNKNDFLQLLYNLTTNHKNSVTERICTNMKRWLSFKDKY